MQQNSGRPFVTSARPQSTKGRGPPIAKTLQKQRPEELSYENQELLKRLLVTISKGERSIERQRQVLANLSRFEPHSAFQRIDRDQDGKITSLEILKFLRDNSVEEATEADTCYIVKYFDSNEDEMLEYEDLMQMVMPCDNQYLRAAIAQRDIYEVTKHDFLDAEIEAELTRLFEKEIALNRVTEELKQEMDATKNFCLNKAFSAIDDWEYGFIDKKNLKSFLRKHNYVASTSECMAIIRRLDLDADARLSKREFIEGLKPEEPYSRALKRSQMKRGSSTNHRCGRTSLAPKSGHLIMLNHQEKDDLRTQAFDRLHGKGLQNGTTPLKARPVLVNELSMFKSPRVHRKRSRSRQAVDTSHCHMRTTQELSQSARSARSRKSSRSLKQSSQRVPSMKRHASAVAGGRRKKKMRVTIDQSKNASKKKLRKSRSRKSIRRKGSMDDLHIERLAKPVDHTALKRKIAREQKLEFEKSRPRHILKRSRSRSEKKLLDKSLNSRYKSFVKKFNKEIVDDDGDQDDQDQWRGANDFTRITQDDDRKSLRDSQRQRPLSRKRSNAEKRELSREITRTNSRDQFSCPRSFLQSKEQTKEFTQPRSFLQSREQTTKDMSFEYSQIIDKQLSSIKEQIRQEPRQPVFNKKRQDMVASPRKILPHVEEGFFLRCLQELILIEKDLELQKVNLSLRDDFNLIDAYGILDEGGKGNMNPQELHVALRRLEIPATQEDCYLLFLRFNRDIDGLLKYSEFTSAFMPVDQHYARQLGSKRLQYCHPPSKTSFNYETMKHYCEVWLLMIKCEQAAEQIKEKLASRPLFDIDQAFRSCDQTFTGSISYTDIKNLMVEYGLQVTGEDIQLLIYRLDKDKDAKINFLEFKQGLTHQRYNLYQQGESPRPKEVLI